VSTLAPFVINDNGAWSWFEDERAVIDAVSCTLLVSSVANGSGTGGMSRHGDVEVVAYDLATGSSSRTTLFDNFEGDDHDSAALFVRPDGRYLAMVARHNTDTMSRWRISRRPGDSSMWEPAGALDNGARTTYSNLYAIPAENGGGGRLYNFARTVDWDPHFHVSYDHGSTWALGGRLLEGPGRPYVRYAADGVGSIHLITTEQHPRNFANGIYHGIIRQGQLWRADGSVADHNLFDDSAVAPDTLTAVFPAGPDHRAWTIDIQLDAQGHPYVVFSVRSEDVAPGRVEPEHRYFYGRFDGTGWHVHPLADAGRALYPTEADYTGLAALHPSDPARLFISTDTHPTTGEPLISTRDRRRHHELFEGISRDGGASWTWTALTANSTVDNIRPVVPHWDSPNTVILWLRGTYATYTDYDLDVVGMIREPPAQRQHPGDRDGSTSGDTRIGAITNESIDAAGCGAPARRRRRCPL
jgi:hypothetical protein